MGERRNCISNTQPVSSLKLKIWKLIIKGMQELFVRLQWVSKLKSMSPVDIELLFAILYNIAARDHNTNIFSIEIKQFKQVNI